MSTIRLIHPATSVGIEKFVAKPAHALLLSGPRGVGKLGLAQQLVQQILGMTGDEFHKNPFVLIIDAETAEGGITTVRTLDHFLSLKVPSAKNVQRAIIIANAEHLSIEAQNALLKTLEDGNENTIIILTASRRDAILPTVQSRAQHIAVRKPSEHDVRKHFISLGHDDHAVDRALRMSGGLPQRSLEILEGSTDHITIEAAQIARNILTASHFEKLTYVDELAKRPDLLREVLFMLGQMARISLLTISGQSTNRWKSVLRLSYQASDALQHNAQSKLTLTRLLLAL